MKNWNYPSNLSTAETSFQEYSTIKRYTLEQLKKKRWLQTWMGPCAGGTDTDLNTDSGGGAHRRVLPGQAGEAGSSVAGQGQVWPRGALPYWALVTMLDSPAEL